MSTDANNYLGPAPGSGTGLPIVPPYPLWMYHPVNPAVIVNDCNSQAALIAMDARWQMTDPNATT